jgi:hypothetical protein
MFDIQDSSFILIARSWIHREGTTGIAEGQGDGFPARFFCIPPAANLCPFRRKRKGRSPDSDLPCSWMRSA